ncbi:unnamed protein product [Darwinula stevensoni]|uniref:DUF4200 domain-containing protein n=1 Tax=Darwinula stevensoni TaxID=69355 RepID=A0A7R9ADU2_9CRUS|nr:unnamed protein product [Darwinula stevensoni]CAG0901651.1 unnamed protein product [Darwinula stevensoni]
MKRGDHDHDREMKERRRELQRRRETLERKKEDYAKHIKETEWRTKLARKKVAEEEAEVKKKLEILNGLQDKLHRAEEELERCQKYADGLQLYQDWMEKVVETSCGEYADPQDALSRYETLRDTKRELKYQFHQTHRDILDLRSQIEKSTREHGNEVLRLNSAISKLQLDAEKWSCQTVYWQEELRRLEEAQKSKDFLSGQLGLTLSNLHALLERYRKAAGIQSKAEEGIVEEIGEYAEDLQCVVDEIHKFQGEQQNMSSLKVLPSSRIGPS